MSASHRVRLVWADPEGSDFLASLSNLEEFELCLTDTGESRKDFQLRTDVFRIAL